MKFVRHGPEPGVPFVMRLSQSQEGVGQRRVALSARRTAGVGRHGVGDALAVLGQHQRAVGGLRLAQQADA